MYCTPPPPPVYSLSASLTQRPGLCTTAATACLCSAAPPCSQPAYVPQRRHAPTMSMWWCGWVRPCSLPPSSARWLACWLMWASSRAGTCSLGRLLAGWRVDLGELPGGSLQQASIKRGLRPKRLLRACRNYSTPSTLCPGRQYSRRPFQRAAGRPVDLVSCPAFSGRYVNEAVRRG